ncbi:MAG: hypothetical protein II875_07160 [Clostridia bacterium]|nr:hypothetical protein [Clostridia bacterium]
MKFNKYQWELYLKAGGQKTVQRFHDFLEGQLEDYPNLVKQLVSGFCPDSDIIKRRYEEACLAVKEIKELFPEDASSLQDDSEEVISENPLSAQAAILDFWNDYSQNLNIKKLNWKEFAGFISLLLYETQVWCYEDAALFFPYFFQGCFKVLSAIADTFSIELPQLPGKSQYMERLLYYGHLCDIFIDFANENDLSSEELFAFLYDYAPACVGGISWAQNDTPEPHNIYVFGYGADYPELDENRKWICQGNPEMQLGDIGLLYHWAPDSCYTSIWRAVSPGFYDPLGIHDRYVCYGSPILIPHITFADLKADSIFRETALVKTNMLRMDGAPMLPSEYMHLLDMARAKGEIPDNVPTFELHTDIEHGELQLERDVEIQLLEPLLLRLGWKPEDWCRQMPVRVGRGTSKYPDYVINPVYTKYNERGDIVLEAKLSIPSKKQVDHDRGQAHSYAKLLGAYAYVLVAKEGIWISEKSDDFTRITQYSWKDLEDNDIFSGVYEALGNRKRNTQRR